MISKSDVRVRRDLRHVAGDAVRIAFPKTDLDRAMASRLMTAAAARPVIRGIVMPHAGVRVVTVYA